MLVEHRICQGRGRSEIAEQYAERDGVIRPPRRKQNLDAQRQRDPDHRGHHRRHAEALKPFRQQPHRQHAGEHADVEHEHGVRHRAAVEPRHITQPRRRPQRLIGQEHAVMQEHHQRQPPEERAAIDCLEIGDLSHDRRLARHFLARGMLLFGNEGKDQEGGEDRYARKPPEHRPPVDRLDQHFKRHRGRQRPERAESENDAVDQRYLFLREPQHIGLERRHQAARHADPDKPAPQDKRERIGAECEQGRPHRGNHQQRRLHLARPEPVENDPERQLHRGERDEIGAGHKPEIGRRQTDIRRQLRRYDRVHRAEQIRHVIADAERQQHRHAQHRHRTGAGRRRRISHIVFPSRQGE